MEITCSYGLILTKMDFHRLYIQVVSIKKMSLQTPKLVFSSMSSPILQQAILKLTWELSMKFKTSNFLVPTS